MLDNQERAEYARFNCLPIAFRQPLKWKTMKHNRFVCYCLLWLSGTVMAAQEMPAAFQGKWVSNWDGKPTRQVVREYCGIHDNDAAAMLTIGKYGMEYSYWEAGETVDQVQYTRRTDNRVTGTARYTQSGFEVDDNGDLVDIEVIFRRKIELKRQHDTLTELFWDNTVEPAVWRRRLWYRC